MEYNMSARQKMTMRAVFQKNQASVDPYGHDMPPAWVTVNPKLPCYVWDGSARTVFGTTIIEAGTLTAIVPLRTDISIDDRISSVLDRNGQTLFGTMRIDSVSRKKDHLEVSLKHAG
jgi:hypothetical protein